MPEPAVRAMRAALPNIGAFASGSAPGSPERLTERLLWRVIDEFLIEQALIVFAACSVTGLAIGLTWTTGRWTALWILLVWPLVVMIAEAVASARGRKVAQSLAALSQRSGRRDVLAAVQGFDRRGVPDRRWAALLRTASGL
jgi:hypothetical protein